MPDSSAIDNSRALRVMIVEDSALIAMDLESIITALGMKVVANVGRAEHVLSIAIATKPDIVLMDINFRNGSEGIDSAIELRNELNTPSIFLTGYYGKATIERARVAQPVGYLTKPIKTHQLVELLLEQQKALRGV